MNPWSQQQPNQYGYPSPSHHSHPYPVNPQQSRNNPIHHWITWPAAALTLIGLIVALTSRVIDYQAVLILGVASVLASLAAVIVSIRSRHGGTIFLAFVSLVVAGVVLAMGIWALGEYNDAVAGFGEAVNRFRQFGE